MAQIRWVLLAAFILGVVPLQAQRPPSVAPGVKLGSLDGPDAFGRIGGIAVAQSGSVYVLDMMSQHIMHFSPRGQLLTTIGRNGEGPGEFRRPFAISFIRDTLWVSDPGLNRLSYFSADGAYLGEFRWDGYRFVPGTMLDDGTVMVGQQFENSNPNPDEPWPLIRFTRDGRLQDTVGVLPLSASQIQRGKFVIHNPFSDRSLMAHSPDGSEIALVHRRQPTGARTYPVVWLNNRGETIARRELPFTAVPVTRQELEVFERLLDAHRVPASDRPYFRDRVQQRNMPAVYAAKLSPDGSLWLQTATNTREQKWIRVPKSGPVSSPVTLPVGQVLVVDRLNLWMVVRDEFDVQYVQHFRVTF